ncbi:hypothetical protein AYO37_01055 [Opitutia bacterium SCGC AG-212-L18]|nr:hypothetical protein AYO37_01055 [Opitutae bacterium SCGC AG-212-L18]
MNDGYNRRLIYSNRTRDEYRSVEGNQSRLPGGDLREGVRNEIKGRQVLRAKGDLRESVDREMKGRDLREGVRYEMKGRAMSIQQEGRLSKRSREDSMQGVSGEKLPKRFRIDKGNQDLEEVLSVGTDQTTEEQSWLHSGNQCFFDNNYSMARPWYELCLCKLSGFSEGDQGLIGLALIYVYFKLNDNDDKILDMYHRFSKFFHLIDSRCAQEEEEENVWAQGKKHVHFLVFTVYVNKYKKEKDYIENSNEIELVCKNCLRFMWLPNIDKVLKYKASYVLGTIYFRRKKYCDAYKAILSAQDFQTTNKEKVDVAFMLGYLELQMNNKDEAEQFFKSCLGWIEEDSDQKVYDYIKWKIYHVLSSIYFSKERTEENIDCSKNYCKMCIECLQRLSSMNDANKVILEQLNSQLNAC